MNEDPKNWLEVSLTLNGEMAEAVADVLARYAPGGVVAERGIKYLNADDPGTPKDEVVVRAYLPVDENLEETRRKLEESLWYLSRIQPLPEAKFTPIKDENWMAAWKEHYRPIPVGEKLIIIPAWMDSPDETRISIKIDPGMAFGTGTHPTTQLALGLLEYLIAKNAPSSIIDVGCGSGILSIAALKLGAERALGVDIEAPSVKSAHENAEVNEVGAEFIIGQGSVDEILAGAFELKSASLVVANMLAPILVRLTEAGLGKLVAENGTLILSRVRASAESHHLKIVERRQEGDWIAFVLKKEFENEI